jgi:hypothetical protein
MLFLTYQCNRIHRERRQTDNAAPQQELFSLDGRNTGNERRCAEVVDGRQEERTRTVKVVVLDSYAVIAYLENEPGHQNEEKSRVGNGRQRIQTGRKGNEDSADKIVFHSETVTVLRGSPGELK